MKVPGSLIPLLTVVLMNGCFSPAPDQGDTAEFLTGADLSSLPQLENHNAVFSDEEGEADAMTILHRHGFNSVRLKVWHTPKDPYNDLAGVAAMAKRVDALGMQFLLDFHYSDWWADPQKQYKPAAWDSLSFALLVDSVYAYTRAVVSTLDQQGTPPDMVQTGNEIRPGMLWPDGRVGGDYDTPEQWDKLAKLLIAARKGVYDGLSNPDDTRLMIHFDNGGNNTICRNFYDSLAVRGVEYDVIGLSFYPKWHGRLDSLEANLADLTARYEKDVAIVEAAYPFTLGWNDDQGNIWGMQEDLHEGYKPTVDGQAIYFAELRRIITSVPGNRGIGLYYWEPALTSADGYNSPWENACLFDFDGLALPAMDAFSGHWTPESDDTSTEAE
jgi:arabinogalactan endo-1,4-beta-galactosidase